MASDSGAIHDRCEAATRLIRQGAFCEALEMLDDAVTVYGEHPALLLKRASVHARAGEFQSAVEDADRAVAAGASAAIFFQRGRWLMRLARFEAARRDFTRVLEESDAELREYLADAALLLRAFCAIEEGDGEAARADALASAKDAQFWAVNQLIDRNWLLDAARRCSLSIK